MTCVFVEYENFKTGFLHDSKCADNYYHVHFSSHQSSYPGKVEYNVYIEYIFAQQ